MSTDMAQQLKQLWKTVFQEPEETIELFFRLAYAPERCRYTLRNGQIVSALYWFDCEYQGRKLAYIYAVATHPDARGQGLASRLLEATHRDLQALGYSGAVLKPANGLFPFYERLGYVTAGHVRRFTAQAGAAPAPLKELSAAEYAAARRQLLPENGILQEGAALTFLHSFSRFYQGPGCLLVVCRGEPLVFEYLGDPTAVPSVLGALSLESAQITMPGQDIPFAMYLPLDGDPAPGYLGLSLE